MSVRLRFFVGTGFSSKLIEWFGAGYFSHVAAVWSPVQLLDARSDTLGGVKPGVRIREGVTEAYKASVDMELPASSVQMKAWRDFLASQLGKPYDKTGIIAFAFNRDWRAPDSWFCSELQAAALEASGLCPRLYTPSNKITPVGLATIMSALGARILS